MSGNFFSEYPVLDCNAQLNGVRLFGYILLLLTRNNGAVSLRSCQTETIPIGPESAMRVSSAIFLCIGKISSSGSRPHAFSRFTMLCKTYLQTIERNTISTETSIICFQFYKQARDEAHSVWTNLIRQF